MRTSFGLLTVLALASPSRANAHPCEARVAQLEQTIQAEQARINEARSIANMASIGGKRSAAIGQSQLQQLASDQADLNQYKMQVSGLRADCDSMVMRERQAARAAADEAARPPPPPKKTAKAKSSSSGCAKDTDCKGDRICVSGACVNPPAR